MLHVYNCSLTRAMKTIEFDCIGLRLHQAKPSRHPVREANLKFWIAIRVIYKYQVFVIATL